MNKKEQKEFQDLRDEISILKALKFTENIPKDVPPPSGGGLSKGYMYNSYSMIVTKACSSSVSHNPTSDEKTSSQNPIWIYSSELLAYKAMRREVELRFARQLAKIDREIDDLGKVTAFE